MVSKKRLDYGSIGFRTPIPRAPRSIRKRSPHKNSIEDDSKLCAFELLAAVAGKLLEESESSASSNVAETKVQTGIRQDGNEKEQPVDDKALKSESIDHGSCAESAFIPETSIHEPSLLSNFKGLQQAENDSVLVHTSDSDMKIENFEVKITDGNTNGKLGGSICDGDSSDHKVESGPEIHSEDGKNKIDDLSMANTSCTVKEAIAECVNTNILINSDSSVQLPLSRDRIPSALTLKHWNNVKLGIRDDDENYFGCNRFSTKIRPVRPQSRIGHRRIRKMLTSKYRNAAPKLKDSELYTGEGVKSFYRYRKRIYTRERCQQAPIKKRKLSNHSYTVAYQDNSSDSISNLPEKANGAPATVKNHQKAKDPHVKFSIKSFKVPELYIEVPETASVGSLKRTVMEAVTAILGGGMRVGVVLQGKKVREDNRTLQQAGISQSSDLETLGFTLEPNFTHVSPSMTPKKLPSVLPCDADHQLPRSPATPMIDSGISNASVDPHKSPKFDDDEVDNNEFTSSPQTHTNEQMDGTVPDSSKALVPVPPMNNDGLAVVPLNPKPNKRSELSQRRMRRPFSVSEVEALVAAVEKLGTGRWRDVKIGAFENADHRTYVDLKDKWKTLVHTASISPQQRRGEPVPQELLNRVLSAHTYWSQNQSKQIGKHSPIEPMKIEGAREEIVGA